MKLLQNQTRLSATDLANHLSCNHLTQLNRAVAAGALEPPVRQDPMLEVLAQRGYEHEEAYLQHLAERGLAIHRLAFEDNDAAALERTRDAMRAGHDVIVQPTLSSGRWYGRADVLLRVERTSALGHWAYEVVDTKLARETRGGTVLQLCLYSEVVGEIQGVLPESMYVVSPGRGFEPERYRLSDYLAYYRLVKRRLEEAVASNDDIANASTYPEPVAHCDICRWWQACDRRRRADDHLSLVAGISKLQRHELESWPVRTLAALARVPIPLERRPNRGARQSYEKIREQARVQLEAREQRKPVYELLPLEEGQGLALLPAPSPGDVFFDIEGDRFVGDEGLEYLFGYATEEDPGESRYECRWAFNAQEEKAAFQHFVDFVMARRERFPDMHVYHYAPYEPTALKRLMGRYATREDEIDRLLRGHVFVDLYAVARHAVRAGVERYSIKDLEVFYAFVRTAPLRDASLHLRVLERGLELADMDCVGAETKDMVRTYNKEDCLSAWKLREWLEALRAEHIEAGHTIPRPVPQSEQPSESLSERQARADIVMAALLEDVPLERAERTAAQHARWLLAHLLEWHWREDKSAWWEYFRLCDLPADELLYEQAALAGLTFVKRVAMARTRPTDRYRFPPQDTTIRAEDKVRSDDGETFGEVVDIDLAARTIDIKKPAKVAAIHPQAVFEHSVIDSQVLFESLFRLAEWVAGHGIDAPGPYRAARDLLLRLPPRLLAQESGELQPAGETALATAKRLAPVLDRCVLPIQGPPGSGKTYTGARMICELVRNGQTVGITAVSHKVIRNLLDGVVKAAREEGLAVRCLQKPGGNPLDGDPAVRETTNKDEIFRALANGAVDVAGGTAWLWANENAYDVLDVLFVDEAGQMSLANTLAVAQAAKSLVLLGDPQQLEQPMKGSHPTGADASALEHLLDGEKTIKAGHGLFLPETWRLHPELCDFTSELFYEDRLHTRAELQHQALAGPTRFAGAGLWFVPVEHDGNQSTSSEEVDQVAALVDELTQPGVTWTDADNHAHPLTLDDILIVAPYNAQVSDLSERLPGARIGTVDKFQGQEAAVVIYSMTTSSPEEAPRGMEFLYSLNRLNVATSRARCVCILVANPRLFSPECQTPRQMQLANAFCRFAERAKPVTGT